MSRINDIERQVTKLLNNEEVENTDSEAEDLYDYIRRDLQEFGGVERAEWSGRDHSEIGDLNVKTKDGSIIHCELKVLSDTERKGTLGNISQATFKNFKLFNGIEYSWKEYRRQKHNYRDESFEILNQYDYYPETIEQESGKTLRKRASMGRHLRDVIQASGTVRKEAVRKKDHNDEKVRQAANTIIDLTDYESEVREDYLNYLQSLDQNSTNIKKLSILLLSGFKKQDHIRQHWGGDIKDINSRLDNRYRTYYAYESSVKNTSRAKTIKELTKEKDYKFKFQNNRSLIVTTENFNEVLRFSLNWKNVFQGIKTDSINVFSLV